MRSTCIFSGSSHPHLVNAICERLGARPSQAELKKFSNGETSVEIQTSVRDKDVFIVQSGSSQINDNVMEMLIMINACKGGSARSITAVMPYFPYSRQSKKKTHRGSITARMLANLMNVAGVNHVITVDLHASQMQGFFRCPVDNLLAEPLLAKWIRMNVAGWHEAVVVSKNPGGTKRVTSLADVLKLSFGIVTTDRRRPYLPNSLFNSAILESTEIDGTTDAKSPEREADDADAPLFPHDFARRRTSSRLSGDQIDQQLRKNGNRQRAGTAMSIATRHRLINGNGDSPSSPLSRSTRQVSVENDDHTTGLAPHNAGDAPSPVYPAPDEDGYEEPASENDIDERATDVITGRLVHGHIVDDDAPSPSISARSGSMHNFRHSSEDEPPDPMMQSFMSTASSRLLGGHGLGGTGDATHSDEEEEEDLKNPEIESTVTLVGKVKHRPVLIVDDMIDRAGSWIAAAETVVKRGGATKVVCMATHGLFGGDSLRELDMCDEIEAIVVTDSFPIPEEKRRGIRKLFVLDVSGLLAEAIRRNHHGESISNLYQHFE